MGPCSVWQPAQRRAKIGATCAYVTGSPGAGRGGAEATAAAGEPAGMPASIQAANCAICASVRNGGPVNGMRGWAVPRSRRTSSLASPAPARTMGPRALPASSPSSVSSFSPAAALAPEWHTTHCA